MGKINIIGLGPGSSKDLTLEAIEKMESGNKNFLRTEEHPTIKFFKKNNIPYKSFDYIYNKSNNFEEVYNKIVEELMMNSIDSEINYFVPGNPLVAENTVKMLLDKDVTIEIISGLSFVEPILELVGKDPVNGLQLIDGIGLKETDLNINLDTIITQIYDKKIISDVKLSLSEVYGDEYQIYFIQNAGIKDKELKKKMPIYKIDRYEEPNLLTSLYIPKVEKEDIYSFKDLLDIMEKLRSDKGCAWDKKQTHKSLRKTVIEEAYELVYAIEKQDIDNIVEELGDVLLQVIFHSQIGKEEGTFNIYEVMNKLGDKLIYRHPHIFADKTVAKSDDIVYNWDMLKYKKRGIYNYTDRLKDIKGLPSLMRSYKIQKEAAKVGFDWEDIQGPLEKIEEEIKEMLKAIDNNEGFDSLEEELGDILFSVVNLSRFINVDSEIALNRTCNKFVNRFEYMETRAKDLGYELKDLSSKEQEDLWDESKLRCE